MKTYALVFSTIALLSACGGDDDDEAGVTVLGPDNPPALGTQIDRMGRPAVTTATIGTFEPDATTAGELKDEYNAAAMDDWVLFEPNIEASLGVLDALDTVCGNQLLASDINAAGRYAPLAAVLADDQLYVDSDVGTCGVFLGVEAELVGALPPGQGGCGGRMLEDDVIERAYSLLAAGELSGIDDTLTEDDRQDSTTFPYVATPN